MKMKMKLCVLVTVLALSSAAPRDVLKEDMQTGEAVLHLNPDLENRVPESTHDGSLLALLTPAELKTNRTSRSLTPRFQGSSLKWQSSYGSVPSDAVLIVNSFTDRYDYVCKYGCSAGFFNPGMGPRCRYPHAGKELLGYPFEILVNKDNSENLEWTDDSGGPQYLVKTCFGLDVYVGRNQYGLGTVHARHKAFFLPWEGEEYWYRDYQVLTIKRRV